MNNKLINLQRNSKPYWSLLKCSLNNKKIPLIPPLFHENKFEQIFWKKLNFSIHFFSKQCSLINSRSTLTHILYLTNNGLSSVTFSQDDAAKTIQNLDSDKTNSRNNTISIMLKICSPAILQPLAIIFKQYVDTNFFRSESKKGHIFPIHKKGDNQALKNYRPVSLLVTPYLWKNS